MPEYSEQSPRIKTDPSVEDEARRQFLVGVRLVHYIRRDCSLCEAPDFIGARVTLDSTN